ncbi:glucosaminidase domain-containing protein [uncultured Draconibacterium sp.]|uniref:glucosaminidase domain-containing protein n=1 Tax=uncultured Draconibacterium sp. TaxID=1573823 RepID=UPI0029C748F4|nr:glucosaminidase domain-containing protein [uncultured Draconibacterium sp.]
MRQILSFSLFILLSVSAFSQKITRDEYIRQWQLVAIEEMNRSGIPASITMAQGCLESGNGNSELSRKSNNHFGIKCKSSWKGKKVYYDDDRRNECFRSYRSVKDSYIDHTNFLMENPRYAGLFLLDPTDYKSWAKGLKKAGYATAHDYDKRLIRIIEENKLHRLDKKMTFNPMGGQTAHNLLGTDNSGALTISPFKTHKVTSINRVKAVVAQKGDTYEMLAQELGLKDWELYKFNDQRPGYQPVANEVVYIQHKKKRTTKDQLTHRVQQGETMHYISQLYGIKLNPLYRRNNMKRGEQPQTGQVIYLRNKKK